MNFANPKLIAVTPTKTIFTAATVQGPGSTWRLIKDKMKSWPWRFVVIYSLATVFLLLGIGKSFAQQSLVVEDVTEGKNIYVFNSVLTSNGVVAAGYYGYYIGQDGKTNLITNPGQSAFFQQSPGHAYTINGSVSAGANYPEFEGFGLDIFFTFGGNTNVSLDEGPVVDGNIECGGGFGYLDQNSTNIDAFGGGVNVTQSSASNGVFSCFANATLNASPWAQLSFGAGAYGHVFSGKDLLDMSIFAYASSFGYADDPVAPEQGFVGALSGAQLAGGWYIGQTNTSQPILVTAYPVITGGSGQTNGSGPGGVGGIVSMPGGVAYPTNSALPVYYFSNLLSGATFSVPAFGLVDYAYGLQTLDGSLIETLTLPTNWDGFVTVSVSNNVIGSFQAGQTVSFTNFPGGGVGQVCVVGDGYPLYIPDVGFPMTLTFNANQSTVGLTPLFLQVAFPLSDQTVSPGSQLTIPFGVQSDLSLSYQWQLNGADLAGQTNAILTIPSVTPADTGAYGAIITTSGAGGVESWYTPDVNVTVPTAVQFTANPTNGATPLAVQFNCPSADSFGSNIVTWLWNFGDGTTSALQNPSHTYSSVGTFSPSLIATNGNGDPVIGSGPSVINVTNLLVEFSASPTNGATPLTVQFNCPSVDSGGNNLDAWQWNFGDGATSALQNPSHTYLAAGTFSSTLIATNENGNPVLASGPSSITVTNFLVQFAVNPTNGATPLTVQFNCPSVDSGGNNLDAWQWNFGDGATSTLQNPSHTYLAAGTFSATLVAKNVSGGTVIGSGPAISVMNPVVQFTASPIYGAPPLTVQFNCPNVDSSGSKIVAWQWNFGDGTTNSALQNPVHTYTEPGLFGPTLNVTNANGYDVAGTGPSVVTSAAAHLYVANRRNGTIGEYGLDGSTVNASLISGLTTPSAIAISGTNLFVLENGTIAEYTTSGRIVNASLISGLNNPIAIAASGNDLFVVNGSTGYGPTETYGSVGEYTTSGATVNASLISYYLFSPEAITVSGNDLFVVNQSSGFVGEYTTSGAAIYTALVSGGGGGIAISGTNLFVANNSWGTIGEYTTSGATVNASLISGFDSIGYNGIAISGTNLFVADEQAGTVGEYTTSGATVNASLISGLPSSTIGIAISSVPPVSLQAAAFGGQPQLIISGPAGPAIVQSSTNLLNWVNVYTNVPPFTFTDSAAPVFPCRFYRMMIPQ